ncbi:MAG: cupin [Helicobacteraceae bacterium]|nr:cupin [Helicobacteraceae bacterium]
MVVASFLKDVTYDNEKVVIKPLINTAHSKEIRIAFEKDQIMKEHNAPGAITVMVLKGAIDFGINGENIILNVGDMIAVEPSVMHSLQAKEKSVVILSLAKKDTIARVNSVLKL